MKINLDAELKDLDGKPIPTDGREDKDGKMRDASPFTVKKALLRALLSPLPDDQGLAPEKAFERLEYARTLNRGGEAEIDTAWAALLNARASRILIVEIAGQIHELLRG